MMKKKCLAGMILMVVFFALTSGKDVKARTLYSSKAELFLKMSMPGMEYYGEDGCPLNDFTVYEEFYDLYTYSNNNPMLLPPGGGSYLIARTGMTTIVDYTIDSKPEGWSVSWNGYPATELYIHIPQDAETGGAYSLYAHVEIGDYFGEYYSTAVIDISFEVGAYTTDCTVKVLDAETGEPIEGALVDGQLGYLEYHSNRDFTDENGEAHFSGLDIYTENSRDITIEATGYETLTTTMQTEIDEYGIFRSYSLTPRAKIGQLIVGVSDVFGDLEGADIHVSNSTLVNCHIRSDASGTACTDLINPGTYHVVITKDGYQTLETDVEMPESGKDLVSELSLVHNKTASLTVQIKDDQGTGIVSGRVDIRGVTFSAQENGVLFIEHLPLDDYTLTIHGSGYVTKQKRIFFRKTITLDVCLDSVDTLPDMEEYALCYSPVSMGWSHSVYIDREGCAYGTGDNTYGQLTGSGSVTTNQFITGDVVMTASGIQHQLFLKKDGTVWSCGRNQYGQLGDGTTTTKTVLTRVSGLSDIIQISAAGNTSTALKSDGTVWSWGKNDSGQLGDGTKENRTAPVQTTITDVRQIVSGGDCTYYLKEDGTVYGVGSNSMGRLGYSINLSDTTTPIQINPLSNIRYIATGHWHAVAVDKKGLVFGWGYNMHGELGLNSIGFYISPTQCPYLSDIRYAAAGGNSSLFSDSHGNVYQCGVSYAGTENAYRPVKIDALKNITYVSGGAYQTAALENDGTIWRWGDNKYGQLGNNTTVSSSEPIRFDTEQAITNNTTPSAACSMDVQESPASVSVPIWKKGEYRYYRFTAPRTGNYTFRSVSTSTDPYGYLLDNRFNQLTYNDDAPTGNENLDNYYDFYMSRTLKAGHTYYIKTRLYSSSKTGSFQLQITCPSLTGHAVTKSENPKLYEALKANRSSLDSENSGTISVNELKALTGTLFLGGRGITSITGLENCSGIRQLYLDRNKITDIDALSELSGLKTLDVSGNRLTHLCAAAGMKQLEVLNAAGNRISDIQGITGLERLRYLYLEDNEIEDVAVIGTNENLRYVTVQNNSLETIEGLSLCTRLRQLNLSGNGSLTDIKPLENLWNLQDLRLSDTGVTTLDRLPNNCYEHLYMNGCSISQAEKERIQNEYSVGNVVY